MNPQANTIESASELAPIAINGHTIFFTDKGPKIEVKKGSNGPQISVNRSRFPDNNTALQAGLIKLSEMDGARHFIQSNPAAALAFLRNSPNYTKVLGLQNLKHLKTPIGSLPTNPFEDKSENLSLSASFDYACRYYILKGQFPGDLTPEVSQSLNSLPKSKRGLHILDELISGIYTPEVNQKLFSKLEAVRRELKAKETQESDKFEYKPQVGPPGEPEPIDPESIETKVTDFYGGYYRGYVCKYDSGQHQITQDRQHVVPFELDENDEIENSKRFTYDTVFSSSKENNLELPYNAVPVVSTVTPANLTIFRANNGSWYLKPKTGATNNIMSRLQSGLKSILQSPTKVSFKFIILAHPEIALTDTPDNLPEIWGDLDTETTGFIQQIQNDKLLSLKGKIDKAKTFVRKKLKYPEDEAVRSQMNSMYLNAGDNALNAICSHGVADCYWSNIFYGQILARLGVNHRLIAGHYVTKDPRFSFAAVAGIGHAWSEWWNGTSWERVDATPAKENEDEESEEQEENENQDGDFGEQEQNDEEQEELTPEQIQELFEELLKEASQIEPPTAEQIFEQEKGISYAKWKEVERFVQGVNQIPVAAENSIVRKPSNIGEEWKSLFDIIYKRRKIPDQSYRGPVRQSEGLELDDPVDAVIDIMAGEDDPSGFKIPSIREREQVYVTEFEDDAVLDLTASMQGLPVTEQKKMILSGEYNLMMLNSRLNLDKYKRKMRNTLKLNSTIFVFKGDTLVQPLQKSGDDIDEKTLCKLYDELESTLTGAGNLVGALKAYEAQLTPEKIAKIKSKKLTKVLTVVSDGQVDNKPEAVAIILRLRQAGIVVQGIGFGANAQDIKVICNDPANPEAGTVIDDATQAVSTRHKMLTKALRQL